MNTTDSASITDSRHEHYGPSCVLFSIGDNEKKLYMIWSGRVGRYPVSPYSVRSCGQLVLLSYHNFRKIDLLEMNGYSLVSQIWMKPTLYHCYKFCYTFKQKHIDIDKKKSKKVLEKIELDAFCKWATINFCSKVGQFAENNGSPDRILVLFCCLSHKGYYIFPPPFIYSFYTLVL